MSDDIQCPAVYADVCLNKTCDNLTHKEQEKLFSIIVTLISKANIEVRAKAR